jgi:hypothetical protein
MVENYVDKIANLLSDRNHGVLVGTLAMLIEVCETEPGTVPSFRAVAPQLLKMLKNLVLSGYAPEHDVSGITDPFLQVKILRALRLLAAGDKGTSEGIADMLAQVATNTESAKNAGNAILYECVLTIVGIEADSGLRVLAVNILGRFLLNRDNNIRYVGLNTLAQVPPCLPLPYRRPYPCPYCTLPPHPPPSCSARASPEFPPPVRPPRRRRQRARARRRWPAPTSRPSSATAVPSWTVSRRGPAKPRAPPTRPAGAGEACGAGAGAAGGRPPASVALRRPLGVDGRTPTSRSGGARWTWSISS